MSVARASLVGAALGPALVLAIHAPLGVAGHAAALVGIAAVYLGTLIGPPPRPVAAAQEAAAAAATIACAALGLIIHPLWLVAGLVAHAAWDWAHHVGWGAPVVRWYPPLCAAVDLSAAAVLLWLIA